MMDLFEVTLILPSPFFFVFTVSDGVEIFPVTIMIAGPALAQALSNSANELTSMTLPPLPPLVLGSVNSDRANEGKPCLPSVHCCIADGSYFLRIGFKTSFDVEICWSRKRGGCQRKPGQTGSRELHTC